MNRILKGLLAAMLGLLILTACDDADVASKNLSKAADNFEVQRRIVFYNGITDSYLLEVTGLCSVEPGATLNVICKTGKDKYVKHFLGTSDNVTWFAEQLQAKDVSVNRYRVTFKPSVIVPEVDVR